MTIYEYDLKKLYEDYFNGSREAGLKLNEILTFEADYGDFTSADDLLKASDMLRKCENALALADVKQSFKSLCFETIQRAYGRIEALWKEYAVFGRKEG